MTNMSKFVRLTRTLADKGILVDPQELFKHIKDNKIDHYASVYYYNEEQYKIFQETGTVANIEDVYTDKIWFDFDSKEDLKKAKKDALTLIDRLIGYNIDPNNIEIYFSGSKGFNVILNLTREISPNQVKHLALNIFGKGLETLDPVLYNPARILRIPGTKHQSTDFYKTPLTYEELKNLSRDGLFEKAKIQLSPKEANPVKHLLDLPDELFEIKAVKEESKKELADLDLNNKPRGWKTSKWALMQGFFKSGERDNTMMILAATCKSMGYDQITSYYMCKSALQKSWERYGKGDFTKEDLWAKIEQVYSDTWKGGSYSEKEDAFLQKKADELGIKELVGTNTVGIKGALKIFKGYAQNIENLTLKTGIEELDNRQRITVGMSWGIIAAPGVGKTSLALQMIHSMSKNGELCIFFSYDMYLPHVVQKIIQKHWDDFEDIEDVLKKYRQNDAAYVKKVEELIEKEYPNVEFCAESGQTIDDIKATIREVEQNRGKKCKFVVIDYNELVVTDVADPTQSSNKTAQNIRALASNEQICILSLFQPSKLTGDPSTEITSYRAAKGGSGIEQSVSLMFGVSRPGFNPRKPDSDKFVSMNCVKNRMGSNFFLDLHWDGYRGEVRSLSPVEKQNLITLRKQIEDEKNGNSSWED